MLCAPSPAQAHGYLLRSIPDERATLERAPVRVQYWFSEGLEAEYSGVTVRDAAGTVIATGSVDPTNPTVMAARLPPNLPDGAYVVELRVAFASDGHVIFQSRVFFVGAAMANVAGVAASDLPVSLEIVWRALVLASSVLLFGVFALYSGVLLPAWGNPVYAAGGLPPRVMRRLSALVVVALVAAFAGNVLALLQQAMVFFNADLGRVIAQGLWGVVRAGTRFGDVWTGRMLLLALLALLFAASWRLRDQQPEIMRPTWAASAWIAALLLGTVSVSSHAAGALMLPWAAMLVNWTHTLGVGAWAGGVAALALVAPVALAAYTGEARRQALLAVLRRFSPLAVVALLVVVTTGVYSAAMWIRAPEQLATTYGGALVAKLAFVAILLGVGGLHFAALRPERFTRWSAPVARLRDFVPTLRLEALLVVVVLALTAVLSATPLPQPAFLDETIPPPSAAQTVGDWTAAVSVTPGEPGINSYDVVLTRGATGAAGQVVRVRVTDPMRDWRGEWLTAEDAGDGLYIATGDEMRRAGDWWMQVRVGDTQLAYAWTIQADPALAQAASPGIVNVLALAGVLVALGFAAYPRARRFYHRLDLRPATVTVALGALLATVGIVVAAMIGIQASQAQLETQISPPPAVVNTVLPDADSLARGAVLIEATCPAWRAGQASFDQFVQGLPRLRDEDVYRAVSEGWRELPPCETGLSASARWDIVNRVRAWEPVG